MKIKLRNDSIEISGYVNAVGRESRPLQDRDGYFTETIQPGAFARALIRGGKRLMLLNHDKQRVIGEEGKNLELKEDAVGLYARATVSDPDIIDKARKNELRGWSFGFRPLRERSDERTGMRHRTVEEMELCEVSIIDRMMRPAYAATSVFTRDDSGDSPVEFRSMEMQDVDIDMPEESGEERAEKGDSAEIDYSKYLDVIKELKKAE